MADERTTPTAAGGGAAGVAPPPLRSPRALQSPALLAIAAGRQHQQQVSTSMQYTMTPPQHMQQPPAVAPPPACLPSMPERLYDYFASVGLGSQQQPRLQRGIVRLSFSQLLSDAPIFLGCSASAIQQVLHSNYQQRMATLKIMNLAASRALLARSICLDPDVTRIQVRLVKEFQLERTLRQREQLYPSKRHAQKSGDKEDADAEEDTPINLRKRRYSAAAAAAGGVSDEPDIFDAMLDALKHFLQVQQRHIFLPDKAILELMKTRRLTLPWRRLVVELDGVIDGLEAKMRTEKEMQIVQQVFTTAVEMIVEEESIKLSDEFLDPTSPDAVEIHFSHIGSPMTLARLYQMATGDAKARESLEQQLGQMVTMRGVITQHSQVFLLQKYEPMHCKYDNCALVGKVFLIEIGCTITCVECSQRLVSISRRVYSERDRRVCGLYRECQTLALSSRGQTNFAEEMRQFQVQLSGARDVGKFMTGDHVEVNGVITARDGADGSRLLIFIAHHIRRLDVTWTDHLQQKADLFRKQIAVTTSHSNPLMLLVNSLCPEVLGQNMLKLGIVLMLISSPLTLAEHLRTCVHVAVVDLPAPSSGCAGPLIQAILAVAPMAARISFDNSRQKGPEDPLRLALSKDTNAPRTIQAAGQNPLALVNEGVLVVDAAPSWKLPFEVHCQLLPLMSNQHLDLHSRDGHSYQHSARDAKTSVFMIGQPSGGAKYDKRRSVSENLRLPSSHLNEFDLVFVVEEGLKKDEMVDYAQRELMTPMIHDAASPSPMLGAASPRVPMTPASAVSGTASRLKTKLALKSNEFEPLPANVFKQYLQLARSLPPPTISEEVRGQLDARFRSLQSTADSSQMEEGSCADVRPLNTLVRLSQARARLELSPVVTLEHVQDVWDLLTYCQSEHGGTMLHGEEHKDMRGKPAGGKLGGPTGRREFVRLMLKNCETHGTFIRSTRECWDMVVSTMRPPPCAAEEMDQFMEKCAAEQLVLQKGGRKWEFDKHLV